MSQDLKSEIAEIASYSSWSLGKWEDIDRYIDHIPEETQLYEKTFMKAIVNIQDEKFKNA